MTYFNAAAQYLVAQEGSSVQSGMMDNPAWLRGLWDAARAHLCAKVEQHLDQRSSPGARQERLQYRRAVKSGDAQAVQKQLLRAGTGDLPFALELSRLVRWMHDIEAVVVAPMASEGLRRVLETTRSMLSADHPGTCYLAHHLACAYEDEGRPACAVDLYEDTLLRRRRMLGELDRDTLITANNLAGAYLGLGQVSRAIVLFERTGRQCAQEFGPGHRQTIVCANNLAVAYEAVGDLGAAVRTYQAAMIQAQQSLGEHHLLTSELRHNLGEAQRQFRSTYLFPGSQEDTKLPG